MFQTVNSVDRAPNARARHAPACLWWGRNQGVRASGRKTGERGSGGGDEHVRAAAFSTPFVAGAGARMVEGVLHTLLDSLAAVVV